jgi:1,4-dihydroxy-2-naphthoate octaprenyltransferase
VFIFFGLIAVGGTYYLQAGELSWMALICSLPPGLLVTAIMVVNNLRDIDTDSEAGKITLAVRLGRYRTIILYKILVYSSYLVPLVLAAGWTGPFILLPLGTLPLARTLCLKIECDLGHNLNESLAGTARLSLVFSLLFSLGMVLRL